MIWDPKTKLVSPQYHVMFVDNFDTVQAPDPNVKITDTMDRLFKINKYTYDVPFGVKLLPLPQPHLRTRTYVQTYPSAQRATQLKSVMARVYSVSRQNLNTTTVP
jgi:hypothetical protein